MDHHPRIQQQGWVQVRLVVQVLRPPQCKLGLVSAGQLGVAQELDYKARLRV